ncbi:hypothetical protein QYE76_064728 [Lolium multiflorum]|uniref:Uncharacterized protein n=1 Tax=Lolium multiflorum TaxID=4521 RepID=A0AAD8W873_LOLMU|nr:hypothetical protein QYE76_064728 [Lolium multiflorum]
MCQVAAPGTGITRGENTGCLTKTSMELESENSKLRNHIAELKKQLEATKSEASLSVQLDLYEKLQTMEKENLDLKAKLLVQSKDL